MVLKYYYLTQKLAFNKLILLVLYMDLLLFFASIFPGFFLCRLISDENKSTFARRVPEIKLWRLQILPSIRIFVKGRVVHVHHWVSLTIILTVTLVINAGFLDMTFLKGAMFGGILQGLTFPDKLNIIYPDPFANAPHLQANITSISSTTGSVKDTV